MKSIDLVYRHYEIKALCINEAKPGQKINYPFLFNRQCRPSHHYKHQPGHRATWFKTIGDE